MLIDERARLLKKFESDKSASLRAVETDKAGELSALTDRMHAVGAPPFPRADLLSLFHDRLAFTTDRLSLFHAQETAGHERDRDAAAAEKARFPPANSAHARQSGPDFVSDFGPGFRVILVLAFGRPRAKRRGLGRRGFHRSTAVNDFLRTNRRVFAALNRFSDISVVLTVLYVDRRGMKRRPRAKRRGLGRRSFVGKRSRPGLPRSWPRRTDGSRS